MLSTYLCADLELSKVNDIKVQSNSSIVCLKSIDFESLIVTSNLKLPVTNQVEWMFTTRICDEKINLRGFVVNTICKGDHHYDYEVQLSISDFEKSNLIRLVNDMNSRLRKSPIQPSCNLCPKAIKEECFLAIKGTTQVLLAN